MIRYLGVEFDGSICFRGRVGHIMTKARRDPLTSLAMDILQRPLAMIHQKLVVANIDYAYSVLMVICLQIERLGWIQNGAMSIFLGCNKDANCVAMRLLLDLPATVQRISMGQTRSQS